MAWYRDDIDDGDPLLCSCGRVLLGRAAGPVSESVVDAGHYHSLRECRPATHEEIHG